ncbi:hypothetical protein RHMOL_Rhmol11G0223700 [Rhododendron molle]|uniref:Uncharacterized protein n=1 Tax=Rhododendron molle TaxID=49168 RepID=A0ACC0LW87_RHOML|nr:hypothetical protein RHMOL_Rhmol11G0223700 [Rhododendron molle]
MFYRWSANSNGGVLESLRYREGYRGDVDVPEGTWPKLLVSMISSSLTRDTGNIISRVPFRIVKAGKYKSTPCVIPDPIGVTVYKALHDTALIMLDITYLSEFRADAHPCTVGEKKLDDCMHWSLPGVMDTWNGFFIAHLNNIKERI